MRLCALPVNVPEVAGCANGNAGSEEPNVANGTGCRTVTSGAARAHRFEGDRAVGGHSFRFRTVVHGEIGRRARSVLFTPSADERLDA